MVISYDTETTGLRRHENEIFAFSTCTEAGDTAVHRLDGSALRVVQSRRAMASLWDRPDVFKVMHNAKFDLGFTEKSVGRRLRDKAPIHDTYLMSCILQNNHPSHALKDLSWELGRFRKDDESQVKIYTRGGRSYQNVPESIMEEYQRKDAERCMLLHLFFWPKISQDAELLDIYQNEVGLIGPTLDMEDRGVMLHVERCKSLIMKLENDVKGVLDRLAEFCGERVNPHQPAKMEWLLFKKLGMPAGRFTAGGRSSTDKEVIHDLRKTHPHPVLELILQYRSWSRGISILEGYLRRADSEGVLHPNIRTCGAQTGRESCQDPNLQNVEKEEVLLNPYPVAARTAFRPRPGYVNFHVDYSGIEMRLLIHYSGDLELVDICNQGGDVHLPGTLNFFGDRYTSGDKLTQKKLRNAAKNTNFAIGYGAQLPTVAGSLDLSEEETGPLLKQYQQRFPELCGLMNTVTRWAERDGKVKTAFGRPLHIPRDREHLHIATNHLIQGTAAEILKRSQIRVDRYLKEATGGEMKMLLPIHDELIIECPRKRLKDALGVMRKARDIMIDFPGKFKVPLGVEVDVSTVDWAHKVRYSLED